MLDIKLLTSDIKLYIKIYINKSKLLLIKNYN